MILSIFRYTGLYIFILLIQLFILKNIFIGNYWGFLFNPQLIVMFILFLPPSVSHAWMIVISFVAGFLFDVFFQSWGVHAASATLVGFVRFYATRDVENIIAAREEENQIWTSKKGNAWKYSYFITFIAIYHFIYILIDSLGHNFFTRVIPAIISSTLITFMLVLILENILYKPARN